MIKLSEIEKKLHKLQGKNDWYAILYDVFEMMAISISNAVDTRKSCWQNREDQYKKTIAKYNKDEQQLIVEIIANLWELLSQMAEPDGKFDDYLGQLYMSSGTSNKGSGQFFTPYCVSQLMAKSTITEEKTKKLFEEDPNYIVTINEPTCGSGGIILAAIEQLRDLGVNWSNNSLVICGDIDKRCVYMTYIQLSLACVPAIILHQDALTLETWDEWHTPAYCMNYLRFKNKLNKMNGAIGRTPKELEEARQAIKEAKPTKTPQATETPQETLFELPKEEPIKKPQSAEKPKKEKEVKNEQMSLFDFEL